MVPQLALLESLSESNSENIELRIAIISVHTNLYSLYMQAGEPEKSLQYALLNIENARDITERDPDKVSANRILSNVISQAGDAQSKLGRDDEARVNFDRAIAILLELVTKHPDDSQLMRSLSFEYNKIGDMLRRQGDYQGAKNYYVSCREIDTNLVFLDESNLGWICDLAISNQRVAEACALLGESADAVDSFETALHHLNKLHQVKPDSSYIERLCISTSGRYAEYLFTIGDFQGALIQGELARDRAAVLRESVGDKPYDLTLWAGLESLVGRALFNDAMQSDGSIKNELLENALLALNNTLQVLEQMEREGISKSYNNKLNEDMLIARDEVVQAIEQVN